MSEPATFNELFLRHQRDIFAYIVTLVPNRNDAEDVFQQTCVALLERQAEYDPQRKYFPWACGFALNAVRRHRRAHHRERLSLSDAAIAALASVQSNLADRIDARLQRLLECMEQLPIEKRDLLMRCYAHRGRADEIASHFRIGTTALYKRLERIRKTLYECMDRNG